MTKEELLAEEHICNGKCQDDITRNYVHCKTCTRLKDFLTGYKAGKAELEEKLANADYQLEGRDLEIKELEAQIEELKEELAKVCNLKGCRRIKELEAQIEKMKQDLDSARENANRQEQWEIYSVLNGIYNDNFEVITGVSN